MLSVLCLFWFMVPPALVHTVGFLISYSSCQTRVNTKRRWRCLKRPWNWSRPPRWDYVGGPGHHPRHIHSKPACESLTHKGHSKIRSPLRPEPLNPINTNKWLMTQLPSNMSYILKVKMRIVKETWSNLDFEWVNIELFNFSVWST